MNNQLHTHYRYDAVETNIQQFELPATATSYVSPLDGPVDFNFFQIALQAFSGGVPIDAPIAQLAQGDPGKLLLIGSSSNVCLYSLWFNNLSLSWTLRTTTRLLKMNEL